MDNIESKINIYKQNAYNKKQTLFTLLEKFSINDKNLSINDYITNEILLLENRTTEYSHHYTYWVDGGLSWYKWYNENVVISPENYDLAMSMSICNLKFHYIFNDIPSCQSKVIILYKITDDLNKILKSKGIICELQTTNFDYNEQTNFIFDSHLTNPKKTNFYNIKLVFKSVDNSIVMISGGTKRKSLFEKALNETAEKQRRIIKEIGERVKDLINYKSELPEFVFNESNIKILENKIIVEFNLEYHNLNKSFEVVREPFDIQLFKEYYITEKSKESLRTVHPTVLDPIYTRDLLNTLNEFGIITFSIINTFKSGTKIEPESQLNIDSIRQSEFIKKINNLDENKFNEHLEKLKEIYNKIYGNSIKIDSYTYRTHKDKLIVPMLKIIITFYNKIYSKFLAYNIFFGDNVRNISYEYSYNHYTKFIDFIDRYFITLFRPVINSFIIAINEELFETHGIKLFVAGGDSMRRYNYDSSFSADIDTKLHIKNAVSNKKLAGVIQSPIEIKKSIFTIVMRHLVNAQNYFEEFKTSQILKPLISDRNKGISVFKCENESGDIKIDIDVLIITKQSNYQFRTRKIDINPTMPVDLFSIDFRYNIKIIDNGVNYETKRNVALLDIVISDDKNFNSDDLIEIDGMAYASKKFLLKDFETTYSNEKMALGRISNGKVSKDIIRYNQIKDEKNFPISLEISNKISRELNDFFSYKEFNEDLTLLNEYLIQNQRLFTIINKLKNKEGLTIQDTMFISKSYIRIIQLLKNYLPNLAQLLHNIWKSDIIPNKLRELRQMSEINRDLGLFYERLQQEPRLNNLLSKLENKETLDIHDFFIINDLCNDRLDVIKSEEFKQKFKSFNNNELNILFDDILNFRVNLPYEDLNNYYPEYQEFSQNNNLYNQQFNSNKYFVVFQSLCNSNNDINNEDDNRFKHIVSYAKSQVDGLYDRLIVNFQTRQTQSPTVQQLSIASKAAKAKQTREANKEARLIAEEKARLEQQAKIESQRNARAARASRASRT